MANLPILLFDDSCGVCHWMVQYVLRHDHARRFAFAPLGAAAGKRLALLWCAPAGAAPSRDAAYGAFARRRAALSRRFGLACTRPRLEERDRWLSS